MSSELRELEHRIEVATKRKKAELVLKNCKIVNVLSSEIIEADIAIVGDKIAAIGCYEGEQEIDMMGLYAAPGFIDSHVHIESSMVSPGQFARVVVPRGTTTVIADPHEIANICGIEGISYMLEASSNIPLDAWFMLPSAVPATKFEHSGAILDAETLSQWMAHPRVLGLGEAMDYQGVIHCEVGILDKIRLAKNKIVDGHGPMISGAELNAYVTAGVRTEHECSSVEEMHDRLRLGMYILIRQGTAAQNLKALIKGVNPSNSRRCLFCTDDKHPQDLLKNGHIDHNIRLAIQEGLDPIMALQMATINAAECYHLKNVGAIAPAYFADIVIIDNLKDLNIKQVFKNGQLVAKDHKALFGLDGENDEKGYNKVNDVMKAKPLVTLDLQILLKSEVAQVIKMIPHSIVTQKVQREVAHHLDGTFKFDHSKDIIKMAVIERHKGLGNIGLGLVEGFGLKNGAIALTIAHDSHNLIVIGDSDESMILAANRVIEVGGGIAICSGNEIRETLRLPIGGIMSNVSMEEVSEILQTMMEIAHEDLEVSKDYDPFMTLAFMALPVIPEIKLTDMGLFDVTTFSFIDISV